MTVWHVVCMDVAGMHLCCWTMALMDMVCVHDTRWTRIARRREEDGDQSAIENKRGMEDLDHLN